MLNKAEQRNLIRPLENAEETVKNAVGSWKAKLVAVGLGIALATFGIVFAAFKINEFYDTWRFVGQQPVIINVTIQWPIRLEKRAVRMVPPETKAKQQKTPKKQAPSARRRYFTPINDKVDLAHLEIIEKSRFPVEIAHIWEQESSQGTTTRQDSQAIYCKNKGMTNELGFYPAGKWCWGSFEEGVHRLEKWFDNEAKGLDRATALCYYNTGNMLKTCEYIKRSSYL